MVADDGGLEDPGVLVQQVRKRRSTTEKRLIVEQALELAKVLRELLVLMG